MSSVSHSVNARSLLQLGEQLLRRGLLAEAGDIYARLAQAFPGDAAVLNGRAMLLNRNGQRDEAIRLWRRLADEHPGMTAPLINIGLACRAAGRTEEAIASFAQALAVRPGLFEAHFNLGATYLAARSYEAALRHLEAAAAARPDHVRTAVLLAQAAQAVCDWDRLDAVMPLLRSEATRALAGSDCAITAWHALRLPFSRSERRAIAVAAARAYPLMPPATAALPVACRGDGRLTIGYISGDFRTHPLMQLAAGLFRRHDRGRFRILAYPVHTPDTDAARILQEGCDAVADLSALDDAAAAQRIRADGVDILVDLSGFNRFMRPGILAFRPAPVQALYLGFAGSLGGRLHDYLIGDAIVTPPEHADDYDETLLRLPGSYQINDCDQPVPPMVTRHDAGLPEQGMVYACFCAAEKIERAVFTLWLAVLGAVPGSVLWLLGDSARLHANLQKAAATAGIDPARLVFAPRLPKIAHMARLGLADLHFDTGTYGAHTTGSDALWAGVPLITVPGEGFPSRVGASLLQAAGLPGLICRDWDDYRRLAIALGRDAGRRQAVRDQLAAAKPGCDLFNTGKTVRGLEALYAEMWQRQSAGRADSAHPP